VKHQKRFQLDFTMLRRDKPMTHSNAFVANLLLDNAGSEFRCLHAISTALTHQDWCTPMNAVLPHASLQKSLDSQKNIT